MAKSHFGDKTDKEKFDAEDTFNPLGTLDQNIEDTPKPAAEEQPEGGGISDNQGSDNNSDQPKGDYLDSIWLPVKTIVKNPLNNSHYTVVGQLGQGSYGLTYLVRNVEGIILVMKEFCVRSSAKRCRTLKLEMSLNDNDKIALEKFISEPRRVRELYEDDNAALNDESYINVILPRSDVFEWYGNHYYVMDKAKGKTLFQHMQELKQMADKDEWIDICLQIMKELAEGVNFCHEKCQFVHQDITPANFIFNIRNKKVTDLKIIDFGLAAGLKQVQEAINENKGGRGSYIEGGTDGFSDIGYNRTCYRQNLKDVKLIDIYSLGAVLYYLVLFDYPPVWDGQMEFVLEDEIKNIHWTGKTGENNKENILKKHFSHISSGRVRTILDACYELVKGATTSQNGKFDNRVQSAIVFKKHIENMMTGIKVERTKYQIKPDAETVSIGFHSDGIWEARIIKSSEENWIEFEKEQDKSGTKGNIFISFKVQPNRTEQVRIVKVRLQSGIFIEYIKIIQEPRPKEETVLAWVGDENPGTEFGSLGGEQKFTFKANKPCSWHVIPAMSYWLQVEEPVIDSGIHVLKVTVKPNEVTESRDARIVITSEDKQMDVPIHQKAKEIIKPRISFPDGVMAEHKFGYQGGEKVVTVIANNEWTAQVASEGYGWLELLQTQGHGGTRQVQFTVAPNESGKARQADIVFTCGESRIQWTVKQDKNPDARISFDNGVVAKHEFTDKGGHVSFNFTSNYKSSVSFIPEDAASWLRVNDTEFESGKRTLVINAEPNPAAVERSADIRLTCKDKHISFHVTQQRMIAPIPPEPDRISALNGMVFTFKASATASQNLFFDCNNKWSADVTEGVDWLMLDKCDGARGGNLIAVKVKNNDSNAPRTGKVQVTCGTAIVTYTVKQEALPPKPESQPEPDRITPIGATDLQFGEDDKSAQKLSFDCNNGWVARVLDGGEWIDLDKWNGKAGSNSIALKVRKNDKTTPRQGLVHITCGKTELSYRIRQDKMTIQRVPGRIVTKGALHLNFKGDAAQSQSLAFSSNTDWTAEVLDNQSWVTLGSSQGTKGDVQVSVSVTKNETYQNRKATVRVTAGTAVQDYIVVQDTLDFLHTPENTDFRVSDKAGRQIVELDCGKPFDIRFDYAAATAWVTADVMSGDAGKHRIVFSYTKNEQAVERLQQVTITCGASQLVYTIHQKPAKEPLPWGKWAKWVGAVLAVSLLAWFLWPEDEEIKGKSIKQILPGLQLPLPYADMDHPVQVIATDNWTAEVVEFEGEASGDLPWLTIKQGKGDEDNQELLIHTSLNKKFEPRKGTVKVTCGDDTKLIRVTQLYDRLDSLATAIDVLKQNAMSNPRDVLKNFSRNVEVFEYEKATGQTKQLDGWLMDLVFEEDSYIKLGHTHTVMSFEEDSIGFIKKITFQKK